MKRILIMICVLITGCEVVAFPSAIQPQTSESGGEFTTRDRDDDDKRDCPVGLVSGIPLDQEFGPGTRALTRCLDNDRVRVVYQINKTCANSDCSKPYAIGNINNAINDYEITHGLDLGDEVEIVAVIYSAGYRLVIDGGAEAAFGETNPFHDAVHDLMEAGVTVYFCQNTARSKGVLTEYLIPGIRYVTSGVTAIADFQLNGYALVQP